MTDLQALLDGSVDHPVDLEPAHEVRRARTALTRRRRRFISAGVVLAAVVVGGGTRLDGFPGRGSYATGAAQSGATVRAGAFEIPPPPDGWAVQAAGDNLVVVAPDDQPKVDLENPMMQLQVAGKLVLNYQRGDFGSDAPKEGDPISYDGRTFYAWTNPASPDYPRQGATSIASVRESTGAWLEVMAAPKLHWTQQQLIDYLDRVVVTPDAVPQA
jgi:hypothetical protein